MGASIHINGTGSSIVDTVFVCRDRGTTPRSWLFEDEEGLAEVLSKDLAELRNAGMKPSRGDIRCTAFGHITRMAIWKLRPSWDAARPTEKKLETLKKMMDSLATVDGVIKRLENVKVPAPRMTGLFAEQEETEMADAVAF